MAKTFETEVVVAGAGPVGLALASELKRFGVETLIFDKEATHKAITKAMIIHCRTQEVLGAMDNAIAGPLTEAVPLKRVEVHFYGEHVGAWDLDHIDSPFEHPVIIGQNRTEYFLNQHLNSKNLSVEWSTELIGYEQNEDSVTCLLRSKDGVQKTVRAKYLVGCDGARSIVRKTQEAQGRVTFDGDKYENEQFIQADCKIKWNLPKGSSYLFLTEQGYMMVVEMPEDMVRVFISTADPNPQDNSDPTLEEIESALNKLGKVEAKLSRPTWLARYRTSHRMASRYQIGRTFLAGDAAHIHVPIGGQGMNTGLQDAFNLGWKLGYVIRGSAPVKLLESYHDERNPVAAELLRGTDLAYRNVLHPNKLMQKAAQIFGPLIISRDFVQEKARTTLEQLNINYRKSNWVKDFGGSSGPVAGERFADARIVFGSDQTTHTLFEAIRGQKFKLLLFSGKAPPDQTFETFLKIQSSVEKSFSEICDVHIVTQQIIPSEKVRRNKNLWIDSEGYLHSRFGARTPVMYVLRPDLIVGFRSQPNKIEELLEYFKLFFLPKN